MTLPWLVWLSGLGTSLQSKRSPVQFPVRAHAWVAVQVPSRGRMRSNHTLMFLSLSFSLPPPLSVEMFWSGRTMWHVSVFLSELKCGAISEELVRVTSSA